METELKLRILNPGMADKIISDEILRNLFLDQPVEREFETRHYDTSQGTLMNAGLAFRVRREGENFTACVKGKGFSLGGLHSRLEYSVPVKGFNPDISVFAETPIFNVLQQAVGEEKLTNLFSIRFKRISAFLNVRGTIIELALDKGEIVAGNKREEICELELELKSGSAGEIFKLGAALAEKYPLMMETRSKFKRGLDLLDFEIRWKEEPPNFEIKAEVSMLEGFFNTLMHLFFRFVKTQEDFLLSPDSFKKELFLGNELERLKSFLLFADSLVESEDDSRALGYINKLEVFLYPILELQGLRNIWKKFANDSCRTKEMNAVDELLRKDYEYKKDLIYRKLAEGQATPHILNFFGWLFDLYEKKGSEEKFSCVWGDYICKRADYIMRCTADLFSDIKTESLSWYLVEKLRCEIRSYFYSLEIVSKFLDKEKKKAVQILKMLYLNLDFMYYLKGISLFLQKHIQNNKEMPLWNMFHEWNKKKKHEAERIVLSCLKKLNSFSF